MAKVVFCEDDPMIQKLIRIGLRDEGHELHIAADGTEGLALIRRERPDVVFTDITMPGLDGYELADRLRDDDVTREIPIVFMTANPRVDAAERYGATVLTKPFTLAELRRRVREAAATPSTGS